MDYLVIFKLTQMFINQADTKATTNVIASCLQSQMLEPTLYSDLIFLYVFHERWLVPHFIWLQAVDDISKASGFRSHHIFVRYFIMLEDLCAFEQDLESQNLVDFETSLSLLPSSNDIATQRKKAREFLKEATVSIKIHFKRWGKELLPFSLGGEFATSQVLANKLLRLNHMPGDNPGLQLPLSPNPTFKSKVHERDICLPAFREFVEDNCVLVQPLEPFLVRMSQRINNGLDLWAASLDEEGKNYRNRFCTEYLPLFSNSQSAEVAVKEAKNVSTTGREEELRTVMAIGRSAILPSVASKNGKDKARDIIRLVLNQHKKLEKDTTTEATRTELKELLTIRHYKKRRLDMTLGTMLDKSHNNKKRNFRQKKRGVVETGRTTGKYQFGLCYKRENEQQMRQECTFRNLNIDTPKAGFQAMKDKIKDDEKQRGGGDPDYDERFFRSLSGAVFVERRRS